MTAPNILWICTDQQRFDSLGCAGQGAVETPHLDALAASGARFTHAYCQSPVCTPSRASFLTGRYPRTTRCRQNGQAIPADERVVVRLLKDALGHSAGLSGKLHLSPANPSACPTTERRIDDGYDVFQWSHHPDPDWPTNAYIQWLKGRGVAYETPPLEGSRYVCEGMPEAYHQTTWCAQMAMEFIEASASFERPWIYTVNTFDPHHPFDPPREYLARHLERLSEIPLPSYHEGELLTKPRFQRLDHEGAYHNPELYPFTAMGEADHRLIRAAYWAMIELIDAQVGRILEALEATGQRERTLVVFMSDHGELLGDHGLYLKGPYFYEPAIRVPLIVSWPGVVQPAVVDDLVELVDVAPTLMEASGLPVPERMQGRSLWPRLLGRGGAGREDVYCAYYNAMPWHKEPMAHATMVRMREHKLVVFHGLGEGELYDLRADPAETWNLWSEPGMRDVKLDLYARLCDRMAWTVDPMPVRQSDW